MTLAEAISIVALHNQWRRGVEIAMQDPKRLGIAIDVILLYLTQNDPN
jgi:hypothetical protein